MGKTPRKDSAARKAAKPDAPAAKKATAKPARKRAAKDAPPAKRAPAAKKVPGDRRKAAPKTRKPPVPGAAKKPARGPSASSKVAHDKVERAKAEGRATPWVGVDPAAPGADKTVHRLLAAEGAPDPERGLTKTETAFLREYLKDPQRNGTAAWLKVAPGNTPASAAQQAYVCLRKLDAKRAIAEADAALQARFDLDREALLSRLLAIATADPNELTQVRHVACPRCWPNERQEAAEMNGGEQKAERIAWTEPDPACTHCHGEGQPVPWLADTRKLSPQARALFAGVKVTRDGVQILQHDQLAALVQAGKVIGAFELDNTQKGTSLAEAAREFFGALHGTKLPIRRPEPKAAPPAKGNPLVKG